MKPTISALLLLALLASCRSDKKLFRLLNAGDSGIHFANTITENDSTNILDYEYCYNGGGVAVADFNNDGLQDLFFTGNMTGNSMYLNQGEMRFKDVTEVSGTHAGEKWNTGVATVDINNDGWMDLYVCASRYNDPVRRENSFFIHQGLNANGEPFFKDMAREYGLADTTFSTQASFFDYDNDGDLDMYLLVAGKMQEGYQPNTYSKKIVDGSSPGTDRLYRNDGGHFTNVSREAGILIDGFGLGVTVTDINRDGWKDIYVSNDYLSNDLLWINNRNGTFSNRAPQSFKHTSYSAMGNDVQDINNDGLADIITLDMLAKDNYRKKTMSPPGNYTSYIYNDFYEYDYQFVRNTFQLNQGVPPSASDSISSPVFSEIALLSGIAETDWSWAPLVADFDNDGYRDLVVSNGFRKDLSDRDFLAYRPMATTLVSKKELLEAIPEVKIADYAFRNRGRDGEGIMFEDVSADWGLDHPAYSNGGVYADLDNDGDLDCVMNTINDPAHLYENTLNNDKKQTSGWLQLALTGPAQNVGGYGAIIEVFAAGNKQLYEHTPVRGYLSSQAGIAHFGLGGSNKLDSLRVTWPDGKQQWLKEVAANKQLRLEYKNAAGVNTAPAATINLLFANVTEALGIGYIHGEKDFIDFNVQRLLPHKLSQYGPVMTTGDLDGNGTEDLFLGGSKGFYGQALFQQADGKFLQQDFAELLEKNDAAAVKGQEDTGVLLFDADGDGDQDLYIVSGGVESPAGSADYQDRLYLNNGHGRFRLDSTALPEIRVSGMAVKAADIDKDGDLDLIRTGRVMPGSYPRPVSSQLLINEGTQGHAKFTDKSAALAPSLTDAGLVSDATWTDFNGDGWMDLILTREWQSPLILQNEKGKLKDVTAASGIAAKSGWWNCITAADFDQDGDPDYILGNNGINSLYQADSIYPVRIYGKDFNNDGRFDAVPSVYYCDSLGRRFEYPAFGRDEMIEQMIGLRKRYPYYRDFGRLTMTDIFNPTDLKGALVYQSTEMRSCYMENLGGGRFSLRPLPINAQLAPVFGVLTLDANSDGHLDVVLTGNDFGSDLNNGRSDALNGLVLLGNGKGEFSPFSIGESGIYIPGDGRSLASLKGASGDNLLVASQNRGRLLVFSRKNISNSSTARKSF